MRAAFSAWVPGPAAWQRWYRALGIDKGKQLHVFDPLDQIKRCLEILFRLAGEADNDITGEGYTGDFLLSIIDQVIYWATV